MKRTVTGAALALSIALALPLAAQDTGTQDKGAEGMPPEMKAMMEAWQKASTPGPQHKQLAEHFVGTWNTKQTMWMDPSAPPMTETGKAVSTAIMGGRHIRMDFTSQWMGQPFEGVALTGYDNVRGKYVGHWIDNMSTGQFLAEGDYDAAANTYTFHGEMPDPMRPGKTTKVREVIRIVDADHHVMEWYESHDGKERKSMVIEYARVK